MSTRTIIEINLDYMDDLLTREHIGSVLWAVINNGGDLPGARVPQGVKILGSRHHSETLKLEVK